LGSISPQSVRTSSGFRRSVDPSRSLNPSGGCFMRFFPQLATAILVISIAFPSFSQPEDRPFPRAWYKPADIERARENVRRHDWARKIYASHKTAAQFYMNHDPEFLADFVPEKTPLLTTPCPKCGAGPWYWSELNEDGSVLRCQSCAT